jgi:F0F1-type ATP synthase membrane subunit b/b'
MQAFQSLILAFTTLALCAVTWGVCHWWYGRQLKALQQRVDKMEKARHVAGQHALQARKQIEQLHKQMAVLQQKRSDLQAVMQSQLDVDLPMATGRSAGDGAPPLPPNGFADTQPM